MLFYVSVCVCEIRCSKLQPKIYYNIKVTISENKYIFFLKFEILIISVKNQWNQI